MVKPVQWTYFLGKVPQLKPPLHLAAAYSHTSVVELLLGKGASITATNTRNNTPLHHAPWRGHTNTVELLLEKDAPIEATSIGNSTPLHLAVWKGHPETVELLLKKGASIIVPTILHCILQQSMAILVSWSYFSGKVL